MSNDQAVSEEKKTEEKKTVRAPRSGRATFDDVGPGQGLTSDGRVVDLNTVAKSNRAWASLQNSGRK